MVKLYTLAGLFCVVNGENFFEEFSTSEFESGWTKSEDSRYGGQSWEWTSDGAGIEGDVGIRVDVPHKFYGLSKVLEEPVVVGNGKDFVVQYEVKFTEGVTCSGSYLKLLVQDDSFKGENLVESSPYSIMFGPDNCGSNNKVHVIFRQENPITKEWEEKHMSTQVQTTRDRISHLYTLEVLKDNMFRVKVDGKVEASGYLNDDSDFQPSFNQPEEIDDPEDSKPEDWVDDAKYPDPEATKPEDWVEEAEIIDPDASIPDGWDEEEDGEWTAPMIKNPAYKGPWSAPMIDNPNYIGEWKPKKIPNKGYFKEENPVDTIKPIGAIAIEILANDRGIHFDSIMLGNDLDHAEEYATTTFIEKQKNEAESDKQAMKEKEAADRLKAYNDGGVGGVLQYYYGAATVVLSEMWEENPPLFLGGVGAIVLLLISLLFRLGGSSGSTEEEQDAAAQHKKDDDTQTEENDDEEVDDEGEDEDEDDEGEGEDEDNAGARKRIPRAS